MADGPGWLRPRAEPHAGLFEQELELNQTMTPKLENTALIH